MISGFIPTDAPFTPAAAADNSPVTVYPDNEQFANFWGLIAFIAPVHKKHGVVKIVPPKSWVAAFNHRLPDPSNIVVRTSGKQVVVPRQSGLYQTRTEETGAMYLSDFFAHDQIHAHAHGQPNQASSHRNARTAHEVNGTLFSAEEAVWNYPHLDKPLDPNRNGFWRASSQGTDGLSAGTENSMRGWHVERTPLIGISYMHSGKRTVYTVSRDRKEQFEAVIAGTFNLTSPSMGEEVMRDNCLMTEASLLLHNGIRFSQIVQEAGEFVVHFFGSYHSCFMHEASIWEYMALPFPYSHPSSAGAVPAPIPMTSMLCPPTHATHSDMILMPKAFGPHTAGKFSQGSDNSMAATRSLSDWGDAPDMNQLPGRWGVRRRRKRTKVEEDTGAPGKKAKTEPKEVLLQVKNRNCHFCEHAPKRCTVFTCSLGTCDQRFCENCINRHLPTAAMALRACGVSKWCCGVCAGECCCSKVVCDRNHVHCKRYRRRIKQAEDASAKAKSPPINTVSVTPSPAVTQPVEAVRKNASPRPLAIQVPLPESMPEVVSEPIPDMAAPSLPIEKNPSTRKGLPPALDIAVPGSGIETPHLEVPVSAGPTPTSQALPAVTASLLPSPAAAAHREGFDSRLFGMLSGSFSFKSTTPKNADGTYDKDFEARWMNIANSMAAQQSQQPVSCKGTPKGADGPLPPFFPESAEFAVIDNNQDEDFLKWLDCLNTIPGGLRRDSSFNGGGYQRLRRDSSFNIGFHAALFRQGSIRKEGSFKFDAGSLHGLRRDNSFSNLNRPADIMLSLHNDTEVATAAAKLQPMC